MTAEVTEDVEKRLEDACKSGDLTTVKSILSDHPDSIHAKFGGFYGNIILTLKNSNHNYLALIELYCLSIHNLSIYPFIIYLFIYS